MLRNPLLLKKRSWLLALCLFACTSGTLLAQPDQDQRLFQKTTLTGEAGSLEQVLNELCVKHKLKLQIDKESLSEEGIDATVSVPPLRVDGITLASALNLILTPQDLTYKTEKGTLYIQTRTQSEKDLVTFVYPLAGLGTIDPDRLTYLLQSLNSGYWEVIDGMGGKITAISPQSITILQTRAVHIEIADLLKLLAAALSGRRSPPTLIERNESFLRRALSKRAVFPAGEVAIAGLGDLLQEKLKIHVFVAERDLQHEGISLDTKITLSAEKQAVGATITTALEAINLSAVIRDEVFYITTKSMADEMYTVQIYDSRVVKLSAQDIAAQVVGVQEFGPWVDVDGEGGDIAVYGPLVLIRHNPSAQEKIALRLGAGL